MSPGIRSSPGVFNPCQTNSDGLITANHSSQLPYSGRTAPGGTPFATQELPSEEMSVYKDIRGVGAVMAIS